MCDPPLNNSTNSSGRCGLHQPTEFDVRHELSTLAVGSLQCTLRVCARYLVEWRGDACLTAGSIPTRERPSLKAHF
jgi:hypothetical protein